MAKVEPRLVESDRTIREKCRMPRSKLGVRDREEQIVGKWKLEEVVDVCRGLVWRPGLALFSLSTFFSTFFRTFLRFFPTFFNSKPWLTCVGLVWRPGLALEPVVEPVCASGFARARARASRQCHVGRRQVHSVLHLGKTEILNSQIFDIMGSEPGDQGQGVQGLD